MDRNPALTVGLVLIVGGAVLIGLGWSDVGQSWFSSEAGPTRTPEPIVPTSTPASSDSSEAEAGSDPATPWAAASGASGEEGLNPEIDAAEAFRGTLYHGRRRWGIGVDEGPITDYRVGPLRLGWYLDWTAREEPARPGGADFAQMVRVKGGRLAHDADTIAAIAQENPGSLWLIGNEPDVRWQDNVEAATYAQLYGRAYRIIKEADPTARVAAGGVTQPTPLRLRYLDTVLEAYGEQFGETMPVNVWNVHNFVLREERDSWGVGIPPGFSDEQGTLYEIEDGDDLALFRQQIVDFRRWMAEHGYQNKPLIVSEYGILMPAEYGFPPGRVLAFLRGTFHFFLTARDESLGYPKDDFRLVQRWCWFSLDAAEDNYPTGRLFDPQTHEMTAVGRGWESLVAEYGP